MHNFLTPPVAGLLAQFSVFAAWDAVWPYLIMLLGFSVIIFVHELGHFAVAKWAGVRVEKFAIGFGRELFGFTKGETRYCFNILPLGGYVKMLGQEDFDDKSNELKFKNDPRSFVNKPVGHRMAIVSAGVIMNVLFAGLLFMIVFLIGLDTESTRIASVSPDSPAERAGLLPGDLIRSVGGRRVLNFNEVMMDILLAPPHEPIEFVVERAGEPQRPIYVKPEFSLAESTRDIQRQVIGIRPGVTREIVALGPDIDPAKADQPRVGDRLVEVGGIEVTDANASRILDRLAYFDGTAVVERPDAKNQSDPPQRVSVSIPPQLAIYPADSRDPASAAVLGLTPLVRFDDVDIGGRAWLAGIEVGDTILSWDDRFTPGRADVATAIRDNPERDLAFQLIKKDGRISVGFVRPERNKRGPATIQALCKPLPMDEAVDGQPLAHFVDVRPRGRAARAGIESGDLIVACDAVENPPAATVNRIIRENAEKPLSLVLRKENGPSRTVLVTPQAPGSIDAGFLMVADDTLRIGPIVATIHGAPSPAAEAGIPPGVSIVAVNNQPVARWRELIAAMRKNAGTTVELTYMYSGKQKRVVPFRVPHCLRTLLGLGPEARILRIDGRETVAIKSGKREEEVSVRYHEGTRAILTELIGRTHVPVEYRENLVSDIKTGYIDVTADMVDPWLGRIALAANVQLSPELVKLKGENALDALSIGVHKTYYFIVQVYEVLNRMIFSRSVSVESMSGPLGIINIGGNVARSGTVQFLFFLAIISANLAVINFLPLPIVDGGLMVFLLIEKIKGSPVSLRVQVVTQMIGIFLIIGAFLFVTYNDAVRLWG